MENDDSNLDPASAQPESEEAISVSEHELQLALEKLHSEQNLPMAIVAGFLAAVAGATIWAAVTVMTEYQIGWMAIGIGFLVGYAMRIIGKGMDQVYGVIGAVLSLVGCALGNLLTMTYFIADAEGMTYMNLLAEMDLDLAIEIMTVTFDPMDVLFYAIAVYFGYKNAFRQVTEADILRALGKAF